MQKRILDDAFAEIGIDIDLKAGNLIKLDKSRATSNKMPSAQQKSAKKVKKSKVVRQTTLSPSEEKNVDILFSSDEGTPSLANATPQKRSLASYSNYRSVSFLKDDAKRSVVGRKGVSQDKFRSEDRSRKFRNGQLKQYAMSDQHSVDGQLIPRSPESEMVGSEQQKALSDLFMRELSEDLIKCPVCLKDIPIFFKEGHAAICQQEVEPYLHQSKTAVGAEEDSMTAGNRSIGFDQSFHEKDVQPNIAIYGLIKELDNLIELNQAMNLNKESAEAINDLKSLLTIAIEAFQNNHVSFSHLSDEFVEPSRSAHIMQGNRSTQPEH